MFDPSLWDEFVLRAHRKYAAIYDDHLSVQIGECVPRTYLKIV
jgi:hypothetical protein